MSEDPEAPEEAPPLPPPVEPRLMKLVRRSDGAILRVLSLMPGEHAGEFGADLLPAGPEDAPTAPAEQPRYVAVRLVRERMEARGTWAAMAAILAAQPDVMLKVLTLGEGLDPLDPLARGAITVAGDDPDIILAL